MPKSRLHITEEFLLSYLSKAERPMSPREIAGLLGVDVMSVVRTLGWLRKKHKVNATFKKKKVLTPDGVEERPVWGSFRYEAAKPAKK